jgi:hypothetical protein
MGLEYSYLLISLINADFMKYYYYIKLYKLFYFPNIP